MLFGSCRYSDFLEFSVKKFEIRVFCEKLHTILAFFFSYFQNALTSARTQIQSNFSLLPLSIVPFPFSHAGTLLSLSLSLSLSIMPRGNCTKIRVEDNPN